jgi:hypothetical protein
MGFDKPFVRWIHEKAFYVTGSHLAALSWPVLSEILIAFSNGAF